MPRTAPYEPVRVSEAVRFRLEKQGAFQQMPRGQLPYVIHKDVASLASEMQVAQTHAIVNELGVLMGPVFAADDFDRAAFVLWAAMLANTPPFLVIIARDLSETFARSDPLAFPLGPRTIEVHGETSRTLWTIVDGPEIKSGVLSMRIKAGDGVGTEGSRMWLMFKQFDQTDVPLVPGTVEGGQVKFEADLRPLGLRLDGVPEDPKVVRQKFWVRLV